MGVAIYDRSGAKLFERMYGNFSADRRVAIASASKLVSGVTLFRLIDSGYLSLGCSWTTSSAGREKGHDHVAPPAFVHIGAQSGECVHLSGPIFRSRSASKRSHNKTCWRLPVRGSTTEARICSVAALMAEVAVGRPWHDIFHQQIRVPLGLPKPSSRITHGRGKVKTRSRSILRRWNARFDERIPGRSSLISLRSWLMSSFSEYQLYTNHLRENTVCCLPCTKHNDA